MAEHFFFDPAALDAVAEAERDGFARATPFPHVVIDGLFPDEVLDAVVAEAPSADERSNWVTWRDDNSIKRGLREDWTMGPATRLLLGQFNSAAFLNFLEQLTGITGLVPDPHFFGGGLHTIERGGYLRVHADFNHHPRLDLERRINALLYLNRGWEDAWGGHLELWDRTLTRAEARIAPVFNRLVIFATTDTAFHGHPNPLESPPGVARRSLALYYYSVDRPDEERTDPHSTLWQAGVGEAVPRGVSDPDGPRPSEPPGDLAPPTGPDRPEGPAGQGGGATAARPGRTAKHRARDWVPPVVWRAAHRLKASFRA